MPRILRVAVIQMDGTPAPVVQRLNRAADLIAEAANSGAQFVVLPELFNTGYEYHQRNYDLAEHSDGITVRWMKAQAAAYGIHLAGSLLLLDEEDIYNSALLIAPDGRQWRYDKNYPFALERAYFREGRQITIANTDLGRFGMLICWDAAHVDLWARYAGKVDAMIIPSSPPNFFRGDLILADGRRINLGTLGGMWARLHSEQITFAGTDLESHAAWMGVPVLYSQHSGSFRSTVSPVIASAGALASGQRDLVQLITHANSLRLEAAYDLDTRIINGWGEVLARPSSIGDSVACAEITLADGLPQPRSAQPAMTMPTAVYAADIAINAALTTIYRLGVRRHWGTRMAPLDPRTRIWAAGVASAAVAGWIAGRITNRK